MFLSAQYFNSDSRGDPVAEWEQRRATALYITKGRGFEPGWSGAETRRKWGQALNPALPFHWSWRRATGFELVERPFLRPGTTTQRVWPPFSYKNKSLCFVIPFLTDLSVETGPTWHCKNLVLRQEYLLGESSHKSLQTQHLHTISSSRKLNPEIFLISRIFSSLYCSCCWMELLHVIWVLATALSLSLIYDTLLTTDC